MKMATCVGGDELAEDWWEARTGRDRRKRNMDSARQGPNGMGLSEPVAASKRKRKKKAESAVAGKEVPLLLAQQCAVLQMALRQHYDGKLTPAEVDQIELQEDWFLDASGGQESFSDLLHRVFPNWERRTQKLTQRGSPLVLLVGSAALRILELTRQAAPSVGKGKMAKLFAKHFKVAEQESFLKSTVTPIAMGTPNRLQKLTDSGALVLTKLRVVVLDWNWKDEKQRTIRDIPEVWGDLAELLRRSLLPLLRTGRTKIVLH